MRWIKLAIEKLSRTGDQCQWALALGACGIFLWLSQRAYFADSEIFSLTLARDTTGIDLGQSYKFLFSLMLKSLNFLNFHGANSILWARFVFALIGVGNLYLAASLYQMIFARPRLEVSPILFILGFTFFLERGYRVRADNLVTTWHLLALWYFYRYWLRVKSTEAERNWRVIGLATTEILLLATTIKGGVILFALQLLYWTQLSGLKGESRQIVRMDLFRKWRLQLDLFLICIILVQFSQSGVNLFEVTFGAFNYLVESVDHGAGMPEYFSSKSFFHVTNFLKENALWTLLVYLPVVFVVSRTIKRFLLGQKWGGRVASYYLYCFILMALFVIFPEKYPFFLASLLPILSLPGVRFVNQMAFLLIKRMGLERKSLHRRHSLALWLVHICCLLSITFSIYRVAIRSDNSLQVDFIQKMTRYFSRLDLFNYYDVIGTIPDYPTMIHFAGPNQTRQNREAYTEVEKALPSFIFYTRKMNFLEPMIGGFLNRHYLNVGNGVYVRGMRYRLTQREPSSIDWLGKTVIRLSTEDINSIIRSMPVPLFEPPKYLQPNELVSAAMTQPIYFFKRDEFGNFKAIENLWVEDQMGFISIYDPATPWRYLKEHSKNLLLPEMSGELGLSIYPPLDFEVSYPLEYLFSYDSNF